MELRVGLRTPLLKINNMGKRRTLEQMEADAARASGWQCPNCGCMGPHRVESTWMTTAGKKRRLICRNCNRGLVRTVELPKPDGFKVIVVPDDERAVA